jgi:tetratricopeptide (TPR) repeat protein
MKKSAAFLVLFLLISLIYADEKSIYLNLLEEGKLEELYPHLLEWEKNDPDNPEMFIGFFNYYLHKGSQTAVAIEETPPAEGEHLELTDDSGKVVGYMYDTTKYNPEDVSLALNYLNRGLIIAPDRLDMHFGKIHLLQQVKDYLHQSVALIDSLKQSNINSNFWLWSDNQQVENGAQVFLNSIQDYYQTWFNEQSEDSIKATQMASEVQMKLYPNHIYGYNNMAFSYLLTGEISRGLEYLLQAETIDKSDAIIINNIALCYKELGNTEQAILYFNKLLNYPDQVDPEYVENMINTL